MKRLDLRLKKEPPQECPRCHRTKFYPKLAMCFYCDVIEDKVNGWK